MWTSRIDLSLYFSITRSACVFSYNKEKTSCIWANSSVQFEKVFIVNPHIKRHIPEKHYTVIVTTLIRAYLHCKSYKYSFHTLDLWTLRELLNVLWTISLTKSTRLKRLNMDDERAHVCAVLYQLSLKYFKKNNCGALYLNPIWSS